MLASLSFWVEGYLFGFENCSQADLSFVVSHTPPQRRPGKLSLSTDVLESVPESPEISISGGSSDIPRDLTKSPPPLQHEPVQLSNPRADEHLLKEVEDGPLFRSRIVALEKKTAALKAKTKKVISRADTLLEAQNAYYEADRRWHDALQQLASTNPKGVQPLLAGYLDTSYAQSQRFHRKKVAHLQILINELRRIYEYDIKAAEANKRAFEEESQDYYHSMTRYLARPDFPNANKQKEKDSKYQSRRRDYELKRFDYWSFMNDLTGGKKEQEILHHLTQYMDSRLNTLTDATRAEHDLKPGLDALLQQVEEASREFKLMRTEREQRRRDIEKGKNISGDGWQLEASSNNAPAFPDGTCQPVETSPLDPSVTGNAAASSVTKGQWLSDVEDEEKLDPARRKKEGILFALSRPAGHNDPKVIPKQTWHKYVSCLSCLF
jgi:Arf-GAP with SH3 domain, ANK repeat and PH domain-containing protein